jgi:hypothetical protein
MNHLGSGHVLWNDTGETGAGGDNRTHNMKTAKINTSL